jgi:hypothetical protein
MIPWCASGSRPHNGRAGVPSSPGNAGPRILEWHTKNGWPRVASAASSLLPFGTVYNLRAQFAKWGPDRLMPP